MDSGFSFLVYVIVKLAAYVSWCYVGLRWLHQRNSVRGGLAFGCARLLLGIAFGITIFVVGGILHREVPAHPVLMYLSIYAPVRYIEWTILAALLRHSDASQAQPIFLGRQAWILGGIAVSHLADLPLILTTYEGAKGFLPVGRFLC
jgi:hypothetical protein